MKLTDRQRRAALDHSTSKCVTAGAGTGKTHVLVQKYIDLIESGESSVAGILALTFTEKAALHMRERVLDAVAEKSGPEWDTIRDDLFWANISTFHGFCARVLREFPLEAGVEPGFSVLDEREANRIRDAAADDLIHGEPRAACQDALACTLRAVGAYELKRYLIRLYEKRAAAEEFFSTLKRDEETVIAAWQAILRRRKEEIVHDLLPAVHPSIEVLFDVAARYPGEADPAMVYLRTVEPYLPQLASNQSKEAVFQALTALAGINEDRRFTARMGRKQNWDGQDLDVVREAYKTLRDLTRSDAEILNLAIDHDAPFTRTTLDFLHNLGETFSVFSEMIDAAKARRGALDFSDLILYTHRLFRDRDDIVDAHLRRRFEFILVDEFQDTDPAQTAIIAAILGGLGDEGRGLFVVGDPKQSIYLFRDADVTQFRLMRDVIIERLGGEEVSLDVNFRSTPEVVGLVNHVFSILMAESNRPWEFAYESLQANRTDDPGSAEILLCPKMDSLGAGRRVAAEAVARRIQRMVVSGEKEIYQDGDRRPAVYGDIAILLERRTNLIYYEWALRRYGIPYQVYAGLGFYQQQEIYDVYNILRILVNEHDDVALYGALRSPYFGVSDARLFAVASSGPHYITLLERLRRFAAEEPGSDVAAAVELIGSWQEVARRLKPVELINRIIIESGVYAVYGGLPEGEQIIANIEKAIGIFRDLQEGGGDLDEIVRELEACIEGEEREGEAQPDLASSNAVAVMTVHASKGLEFPVVVVPDLSEQPLSNTSSIIIEDGLRLGVKIADPESDHERKNTPILTVLKDELQEKDEAERKRLFYVALTRARDHLILCGVVPDSVPESVDACKTRADWLTYCLGLSVDVCDADEVEIFPPGEDRSIRIGVCTSPKIIPAEVKVAAPSRLTIPKNLQKVQIDLQPLREMEGGEAEERIYRLNELERHLLDRYGVDRYDDAEIRGQIIREVFRGRDPATVIRRYRVDDARLNQECDRAYEEFQGSYLVQGADRDYCDVSFHAKIGGALFAGTIDRLLRQSDGTWVLVDYKLGREDGMSMFRSAQESTFKAAICRRAAEEILGEPVRAYLYFTDTGRLVEVPEDDGIVDLVRHVIQEIEGGVGG